MEVVLILLVLTGSLQPTAQRGSSSSDCSDDDAADRCDCDCDTCAGAPDCCTQMCDNCKLFQSNVVYLPYPYPVIVPPGQPVPPPPPPPYGPYIPPYIPPLTPAANTTTELATSTTEATQMGSECTDLAKCTQRVSLFDSLKLPSPEQMLRMAARLPARHPPRQPPRQSPQSRRYELDTSPDLADVLGRVPPQLYRPSRNFYSYNDDDSARERTNF